MRAYFCFAVVTILRYCKIFKHARNPFAYCLSFKKITML